MTKFKESKPVAFAQQKCALPFARVFFDLDALRQVDGPSRIVPVRSCSGGLHKAITKLRERSSSNIAAIGFRMIPSYMHQKAASSFSFSDNIFILFLLTVPLHSCSMFLARSVKTNEESSDVTRIPFSWHSKL